MNKTNKFFSSILLILILVSTLNVLIIEGSNEILPKWEYVAPQIDDIDLHGGVSQWSDYTPIAITLQDISGSGVSLLLDAYFGYNATHLFIGLLIPDQEVTVYGVEIIFIANGDIYDGIIVDTDLQEGRDVTYVNTTHVAFDTDLGGLEFVSVDITDYGEEEFYMIVDDVRYPSQDMESDWDFDDGDSAAVVFQAWGNKEKNATNRPNFSTVVNDFNYLRLSINYDNGDSLALLNPTNIGKMSDKERQEKLKDLKMELIKNKASNKTKTNIREIKKAIARLLTFSRLNKPKDLKP